MNKKYNSPRITILSALITVLACISLFYSAVKTSLDSTLVVILSSSAVTSIAIIFAFRFFRKNQPTMVISLLGFPYSGKTVYLTVLFNEILVHNKSINYSLYGTETVERVSTDYKTLQNGSWLPATPSEGIFYYRAATPRYRIEIGDYAGEHFVEELVDNENYLHRTKYFKYVVTSDVVFLAVDLYRVVKNDIGYINDIERSLIAALQVLHEQKSVNVNRKIQFPVALLFLKADYLSANLTKADVLSRFKRIIEYCTNHCKDFHCFFVSAVSSNHNYNNLLPVMLQPYCVIEPLDWAISRVRRLF